MRAVSLVAVSLAAAAVLGAMPVEARRATSAAPRVDLADMAVGTYEGDVISDARGSSRSDVTITVTKVAPGTVRVSSSYARLPTFTTRLTRAMQTIQQVGSSPVVFLLDLEKSPRRLDITVDDASWAGEKE